MPEKNEIIKRDEALLKKAADDLGEFFDSVSIFVTRYEASMDGTVRLHEARGNVYARLGWVGEWVEIERGRARERGARLEREHDDD